MSTVFGNFLKNVKTLEAKNYIKIFSIPEVISGRNIKRSIFPTLCHIFSVSLGPDRESLLSGVHYCEEIYIHFFIRSSPV